MDVSTVAANEINDTVSLRMKSVSGDKDLHVIKYVSKKGLKMLHKFKKKNTIY